MSGTLHFEVPAGKNGKTLAQDLASRVRTVGEAQGIKIPKAISLFGVGNLDFDISYTSNAMRDIILAEAAIANIPRKLYDSITEKWYTVTRARTYADTIVRIKQ